MEYNYKYYLLLIFRCFVMRIDAILFIKCLGYFLDKYNVNLECYFNVFIIIIEMGKMERI